MSAVPLVVAPSLLALTRPLAQVGAETRASGALVLAVLGGGLFLLGLGIALFAGATLKRRGTVAGSLMLCGALFLLILLIEARGDAPTLEPARPGPYPVPTVGGSPPPR